MSLPGTFAQVYRDPDATPDYPYRWRLKAQDGRTLAFSAAGFPDRMIALRAIDEVRSAFVARDALFHVQVIGDDGEVEP